ncbi:HAD family hydrolase [Paenibacillus ginsengarvi]|uniref:HAD family hydrolase n=1 Tax=Paenibacillus ginsengarvi TaxID=400777 RepID=A0A3B0C5G1_9BACL|nr:HAD family hydrolase [Paenibacillus ginsengarvi]RKN79229.1 HAD family hydrolase [Paenibacillus ginsengarvi]
MTSSNSQAGTRIKAVLFDFDGTLSTLRAGWEETMAPMMKVAIAGSAPLTPEQSAELDREIAAYIDQSTGIQTIFQMRWLAEQVAGKGWNPEVLGEWEYKAEYNRRLLESVNARIERLRAGSLSASDYLMKGSVPFLEELRTRGIEMFVASGTDHPDVVNEAEVLGVRHYFQDIAGAPVGRADCSKEKVIADLLEEKGFRGDELAVIGDGKVEIRLARERGALALGIASDENRREGINPVKRERLLAAGAHHIAGDFLNKGEWLEWLGWQTE